MILADMSMFSLASYLGLWRRVPGYEAMFSLTPLKNVSPASLQYRIPFDVGMGEPLNQMWPQAPPKPYVL